MNALVFVRLTLFVAIVPQVLVHAARASQRCGSLNLKASNTVSTLTSPRYPDIYPSDTHCAWRITSDSGKDIVIKIDDVFIEDSDDCGSDSLSIYKSLEEKAEQRLVRLCGRGYTRTIQTRSSQVLVVFRSDVSVEEKGFKLQYHAGEEDGCLQTLTSSSGIITSPRYPSNYPDLSDCASLIRVPRGKQIYLSFEDLTLEFDDDCKSDYVEVFDGPNKESKSIGRFCGFWGSTSLQSTRNELYVVFHSDRLINAKGFKAVYSSEQGGSAAGVTAKQCQIKQYKTNGTISSPGYPSAYEPNSNCKAQVSGPQGTTVVLVIEDLGIEPSPSCAKDYVEIKDGKDKNSPNLARLCGETRSNRQRVLTSSRNHLSVIFNSDSSGQGKGFRASYFIQTRTSGEHKPFASQENSFFKFDMYPRNATVEEGKRHTLQCAFNNGYWKWFKDNVPIDKLRGIRLADARTLVIENMVPELVGIYACEAYTIEGIFAAYSWISIKPTRGCRDHSNTITESKLLQEDDKLSLDCASADHDVEFRWMKNGKNLIINDRITSTGRTITIARTKLSDSGLYECLATKKNSNCEMRFPTNVLVKPRQKDCGQPRIRSNISKPDVDDQNRIVGGREAVRGAYPWQVVFYHKVEEKFFCGGSLVTSKWVLTAAHCYLHRKFKIEDTEVRLGKNNVNEREPGEINTGVVQLLTHPDYNKEVRNNHDIALVELSARITFTDYISTICFEDMNTVQDEFIDETYHKGTVTGWGSLQEHGEQPAVLQELVLPIQPRTKCKASTMRTITENMFCAGYDEETVGAHLKRDACTGDSGSPLAVRLEGGRWVAVGIVSWGEGCARRGKYGFYTKVDNYYDWIRNNTFG